MSMAMWLVVWLMVNVAMWLVMWSMMYIAALYAMTWWHHNIDIYPLRTTWLSHINIVCHCATHCHRR